jgi:TonB family protein
LPAVLAAAIACSTPVCCVECQQPVFQDPFGQAYQRLLQSSDLEAKPSEPFLIKLDYQLYDLEGNPSVKGTAERAWGQIAEPHTFIRSSTLQMDESAPEEKLIQQHTRESYLVHQALNAIVHPLPYSNRRFDFILRRSQQTVDNLAMHCLSLEHAGKEPPGVVYYCSDESGELQAMLGEGPFITRRSDFKKFGDRQVPWEINIAYRGKPAITAHVTQLDALPPVDKATVAGPTAGGLLLDHDSDTEAQTTYGNGMTAGSPTYPFAARLTHATGLVVLTAIVTKTGSVTGVDVVSSASPALSKAAIDAAKKWLYAPYRFKGQPIDADTTITVDFSLSGP